MPAVSSIESHDVEVVKAERAGIYDVKVIQSDSAEGIIAWLNENSFNYDDSDKEVFEDYISRGWCFVVANVRPEPETDEEQIIVARMVAPLILQFETPKAVYPIVLTSTIGQKTEVLLYTLSENKLDCNGRLKLRVALSNKNRNIFSADYLSSTEILADLSNELPKPMFLCKFKSELTPEQMKEDIFFENAPDNEPYRETVFVW